MRLYMFKDFNEENVNNSTVEVLKKKTNSVFILKENVQLWRCQGETTSFRILEQVAGLPREPLRLFMASFSRKDLYLQSQSDIKAARLTLWFPDNTHRPRNKIVLWYLLSVRSKCTVTWLSGTDEFHYHLFLSDLQFFLSLHKFTTRSYSMSSDSNMLSFRVRVTHQVFICARHWVLRQDLLQYFLSPASGRDDHVIAGRYFRCRHFIQSINWEYAFSILPHVHIFIFLHVSGFRILLLLLFSIRTDHL